MKTEKYIIDDPKIESSSRRKFEWTVTFVAWAAGVYFLAPIATLFLWMAGLRLVVLENFMLDHVAGLKSVLGYYGAGILIIWILLALWSRYNLSMFGGQDRRKFQAAVSDEEMAEHFKATGDSLEKVKLARNISVHSDGTGFRLAVE